LLQALLEHGADVTVPAPNGFVPIHVAATHGRFEVCQMLLDAGADQGC
jgi:ankyrin repeat protein